MRIPRSLSMCLALFACATVEAPLDSRSMQLKAPSNFAFVHGPSTDNAAALKRWLEQWQPATVRLPLMVTGLAGVVLGKDPLPLKLQDTALGISLADRARSACPEADRCALWLEGRWTDSGLFVSRVVRAISAEEQSPPLFAQLEVPEGRPELAALIDRLGSEASIEDKREAAQALRLSGRDAIPLLIASLSDERPYEVRDIANRMNLPAGATVAPLISTMTVGTRCEDLLHDVITPSVPMPSPPIKVFSEQVLRITDWRAFWEKRHQRSLEEIHAELAPLVRAYWDAHGTTQTVP